MNRGLLLNSSFAVPRSIAGCVAAIGEVARSDGGVEKTSHKSVYIEHIPLPLPCPVVLRGVPLGNIGGVSAGRGG